MQDLFQRYGNLLKADGTHQLQRLLPALEEGFIRPDERSFSDLVEQAHRLAEQIRFYSPSGQVVGDWRPFFDPLLADSATGRALSDGELRALLGSRTDWPPHLALWVVFLELFRHLQHDLDELPRRHARFYYEEVLRLHRRPPVADQVHVLFELAKHAAPTLLPAGTALDAGKDPQGRSLVYRTQNDLVVNAARVAQIRRLVVESEPATGGLRGTRRFFVAGARSPEEGPSWATFGYPRHELASHGRFMTEAEIGFAISSPLLRLAEGTRTVRLLAALRTAAGHPPPSDDLRYDLAPAFELSLSGPEGWLTVENPTVRLMGSAGLEPGQALLPSASLSLEIAFTLDIAVAPIVPFEPHLHGEGTPHGDLGSGDAIRHPTLRCLLRDGKSLGEALDDLTIERLSLSVQVEGVHQLMVRNEQGPLRPDGPMQPFGSQPRTGARFYVGSAEVFGKALSSLELELEWQDLPDLPQHYSAYFGEQEAPGDLKRRFVFDIDLLHDGSWDHPLSTARPLFAEGGLDIEERDFQRAFGGRPYTAHPELTKLRPYGTHSQLGFLRLTLRPTLPDGQGASLPFDAFGHREFPNLFASQAIALSQWEIDGRSGPEPKLPEQPYTPTLASLSLGYTASATWAPGAHHGGGTLLGLGPWGHRVAQGPATAHLVPPFEGRAALFIGLEGFRPPANLSLLFQIDSGTATADEVLEEDEAEWSTLDGDTWRALPREARLSDTTQGFQQPGLVVLALGPGAASEHRLMPSGLVWLRVAIHKSSASAARTLELATQAVRATFEPVGGPLEDDCQHLEEGLAPATIRRLKAPHTAIKGVRQPYPSFGGRGTEGDAEFFRRSSERLRHRGRAATTWDFERLVLEAFPEVFKVKCLPHSDAEGLERAGEVTLVIVPDPRGDASSGLLEPRAGAVLMARIRDFMSSGIAPEAAAVHVVHPVYERLRVDTRVAFHQGYDRGYHTALLDRELQRFLSPWAFAEGQDIVFGARVYRSELLAFVEGRDYVDFVTDLRLYHLYDGPRRGAIGEMEIGRDFRIRAAPRPALSQMRIGDDFVVGEPVEVAEATHRAILVSHPEHRIQPLEPGEQRFTGASRLGIGYRTVGFDFAVETTQDPFTQTSTTGGRLP